MNPNILWWIFRWQKYAIESEFPDVAVYIFGLHHEQAWQRWAKSGKGGLTLFRSAEYTANTALLAVSALY